MEMDLKIKSVINVSVALLCIGEHLMEGSVSIVSDKMFVRI